MYSFFGLFADPVDELAARCKAVWPGLQPMLVADPASLLGLRFDPEFYVPEDEDIPDAVSARIIALSREYPAVRFVVLRTECFGGLCSNWGYIAQAGDVTRREKGDGALSQLMAVFEIDLGSAEIFAPLTRDFPWPQR